MRFAIVVSEFNREVTEGLLRGARDFLTSKTDTEVLPQDILCAPGAFELPLIAKALSETRQYDGIICLGAVIKGETAHFEFISAGATFGLMQAMLDTDTPISFGVLTAYTDEQAYARSQPGPENKGKEAAEAVWKTAQLLKSIRSPR